MGIAGKKALEVMDQVDWYNDRLLSEAKPYLSGDILEVGFGIGTFSEKLSEFGRVTAIDNDRTYLKNSIPRVSSGYGDIEKGEYFFGNKLFDGIYCTNVLEHIENDQTALNNMASLLKQHGYLVLNVPAHMLLYSDFDRSIGHYRRYSIQSIENSLDEAGLTVKKIEYLNGPGALGWLVMMKLMHRKRVPSPAFLKVQQLLTKIPGMYSGCPFGLSVFSVSMKK